MRRDIIQDIDDQKWEIKSKLGEPFREFLDGRRVLTIGEIEHFLLRLHSKEFDSKQFILACQELIDDMQEMDERVGYIWIFAGDTEISPRNVLDFIKQNNLFPHTEQLAFNVHKITREIIDKYQTKDCGYNIYYPVNSYLLGYWKSVISEINLENCKSGIGLIGLKYFP